MSDQTRDPAERLWCVWAVLVGVDGVVKSYDSDEDAARAEWERVRDQLDADRDVVAYGFACPGSEVHPGVGLSPLRDEGKHAPLDVPEIQRVAAFMLRTGWREPVEGEDEGGA